MKWPGVTLVIVGGLALGAGSVAGFSACSSPSADGKVGGELMLAVTTDLVPGKDLDRIDVTVEHHGRVQLQESLPLGGGKGLPATIPITALAGDTDPVTVHVVGYLGNTAHIQRDAVTTVPDGRTALLYAPLQYLCAGVPACPGGQTCVAGACAPQAIDVKTLPDYAYDKVFKGPCLDVAACFAGASTVSPPTLGDCKLTEAPGSTDNYALRLHPGSPGTCGVSGCDIPLVQDSLLGWNGQQLPPRVCTLLGSGGAQLMKSTKCPTMTLVTPTCQEEPSDGGAEAGAPAVFVSSDPHQPTGFVVVGKNIFYASADNAVVELDTSGATTQAVIFPAAADTLHGLATDGVDVAWSTTKSYNTAGVWAMHGGQVIQVFGVVGCPVWGSLVMDLRQAGVIYYLKNDLGCQPNAVVRVNSDGTHEATVYTGGNWVAPDSPQEVVAADDASVFWLDNSGLVAMSPPTASGTRSALTTQGYNVDGSSPASSGKLFQVVGGNIYWNEWNSKASSTVKRLPTTGATSPTDVGTIPNSSQNAGLPPCGFVLDATYLYYCDASGASILRQSNGGGPAFSVAQLPGFVKNGAFSVIRLAGGKLYAQVNDTDAKSSGFLIVPLPL